MAGDAVSNTQAQTQIQLLTVSVESSGDPDLERRIFSQVHSAGRQLKTISAVVEVLLAALAADPNFAQTEPAKSTIEAFKNMQLDILRAKCLHDPNKLVSQLDALQHVDPTEFANVRDRLKDWLRDK
jgi:hypothetical protein